MIPLTSLLIIKSTLDVLSQGLLDAAIRFGFGDNLTFVVLLTSQSQRKFDLGIFPLEVDGQGDEGLSFLFSALLQFTDFSLI